MPRRRRLWLPAALALAAVACGGSELQPTARDLRDATDLGRTVEPSGPSERAVLAALDRIPPDSPRVVQGVTVTAGPKYYAASGRTCRSVQLKHGERHDARMACTEGEAWFFVPNVFEPSAPAPGP